MILSDSEISKLQEATPPLVQEAPDFSLQLQSNGFDLTVKEIYSFKGCGQVDFSNHERKLPDTKLLEFKDGWLKLKKGAYKVKTNEILHIPNTLVALAETRSSLLRMGAYTVHAFWDAGFSGRSEFLLVVENPKGIKVKESARVAQIAFINMAVIPDKPYEGIYKGLD
ncbi:deoxyuridine 5'-triphosphate nucleotidohydrolase [archaeon]|nr:deoxyuridine 5'-triphosphate nucleotidohydrolase [archaeon]